MITISLRIIVIELSPQNNQRFYPIYELLNVNHSIELSVKFSSELRASVSSSSFLKAVALYQIAR